MIKFREIFSSEAEFGRLTDWLLIGFACSTPLSIAFSQMCIVSVLIMTIFFLSRNPARSRKFFKSLHQPYWQAITCWLVATLIAAVFGGHFNSTASDTFKTAFYMLVPFAVQFVLSLQKDPLGKSLRYLTALISGQVIAALHSLFSAAVGHELSPHIPGRVTEAGQLVLVIPAVVALIFMPLIKNLNRTRINIGEHSFPQLHYLALFFLALLVFGWPELVAVEGNTMRFGIQTIAAIIIGGLLYPLLKARRAFAGFYSGLQEKICAEEVQTLLKICGVFLVAALIFNLKRGSWLGVVTALGIIGLFLSRRLALSTLVVALIFALTLGPARTRISQWMDDFSISGGRKDMWALGLEMVEQYPLGVGIKNARLMQQLDPTLPPEHRHMHNNFLNIAVETGWIGLAAYCWWLWVIFALGFDLWKSGGREKFSAVLALCLTCALLGWQAAGLVEYNFGDGEVRFIALLYLGMLLTLQELQSLKLNTAQAS